MPLGSQAMEGGLEMPEETQRASRTKAGPTGPVRDRSEYGASGEARAETLGGPSRIEVLYPKVPSKSFTVLLGHHILKVLDGCASEK